MEHNPKHVQGMKEQSTSSSTSTITDEENQRCARDLNKIRHIINAQAFAQEQEKQKQQARQSVGDVFTEAFNDRQSKDGSVSKVLVPIIEDSVLKSITKHRQMFVDSLFPLVGELVRKFTTAFLRDFVEKTNEVLEKSVTLKSVGWRFKAWRAGVRYSSYVASQTYLYQIQQVLLIHQETGILLQSVSLNVEDDENSDVVSAMLTAIDDFVSDSFANKSNGAHLDEIKTDNFTLYLLKGPKAFLVAAVTGSISPKAKTQLQTTLEDIHASYSSQLNDFQGDTSQFSAVSNELNECLLSESKREHDKVAKKPILGIAALLGVALLIAYWSYLKWETSHTIDKIQALPHDQGIVLSSITNEGVHKVSLVAFRDPRAPTIEEWLKHEQINLKWVTYSEVPFISLSKQLTLEQIEDVIKPFSGITYSRQSNQISGDLSGQEHLLLLNLLRDVTGIKQHPVNFSVNIKANEVDTSSATKDALAIIAGQITQLQITFDASSAKIIPSQQIQLVLIVEKYIQLQAYAAQAGLSAKLLVMGTSDSTGNVNTNRKLSAQRAENTKQALIVKGIKASDIMSSGFSIIDDAATDTNMRKALINVVYNPM